MLTAHSDDFPSPLGKGGSHILGVGQAVAGLNDRSNVPALRASPFERQALRHAVTSIFPGTVLSLTFQPNQFRPLFGAFEADRRPITTSQDEALYRTVSTGLDYTLKRAPQLEALAKTNGFSGSVEELLRKMTVIAIDGYPGIFLRAGVNGANPPPMQVAIWRNRVYVPSDFLLRLNPARVTDRALLGYYLAQAVTTMAAFSGKRDEVLADVNRYQEIRLRASAIDGLVEKIMCPRTLAASVKERKEDLFALNAIRVRAESGRAAEMAEKAETEFTVLRRQILKQRPKYDIDLISRLEHLGKTFALHGFCIHRDHGFDPAKAWYNREQDTWDTSRRLDPAGIRPFDIQTKRIERTLRWGTIERFQLEIQSLCDGDYVDFEFMHDQRGAQRPLLEDWMKTALPGIEERLHMLKGPFGPGLDLKDIEDALKLLKVLHHEVLNPKVPSVEQQP